MSTPRRFPFVQLDVFTNKALQGNQLAVFTDARGLTTEQMQLLAKETNLSETTFIFPRDEAAEKEHGFQVRIFTVDEELPFAGHPTLGTAYYLHQKSGLETVELDLKVGKIPVRFSTDNHGHLRGEMRQRDPEFGQVHSIEAVSDATGIPREAFDTSLPIQTVSTGMPFVITPLKSLEYMSKLNFNWKNASGYLEKSDGKFFYLVTPETVSPEAKLHARMIFYNGEDPATGSAAGCCTAWAVQHGVLQSEEQGMIEQGLAIRRPSRIFIRATKVGTGVTNVRVAGGVVQVSSGEFSLE
jgi:trans-2,3-dihydro-3-hydroxyanthranilate isomerase